MFEFVDIFVDDCFKDEIAKGCFRRLIFQILLLLEVEGSSGFGGSE